jgi:hypothetical protein
LSIKQSDKQQGGKQATKKRDQNRNSYDKRRPLNNGNPNGDSSTGRRPDYGSSYERNKARNGRPDYGSSYERAKARQSDRRRDHKNSDGYSDGHKYGNKDKHKGNKNNKGKNKNNKGKNNGHKGNNKGHGNNHHNKTYKNKTVNKYYGYGYGHGGYYNSYYPYSYCSPYYSIGYNSYSDGLSFSIGLGSSYWNNWCSTWPSYGINYGYNSYVDPYYNNTIVVIDDEPEVVYVPIEASRPTYDLSVGWEHLANGRDENALKFFSNRVRKWGDSSSAKAGYAFAAAQMHDRSRAVWSMRRAFRIDNGDLGYLPLDTRLRRLAELLESRYVYDAQNSTGRDHRHALFMVAALRYILHEPEAALDAAYAAQDSGDHDSSLDALIRIAESELDY